MCVVGGKGVRGSGRWVCVSSREFEVLGRPYNLLQQQKWSASSSRCIYMDTHTCPVTTLLRTHTETVAQRHPSPSAGPGFDEAERRELIRSILSIRLKHMIAGEGGKAAYQRDRQIRLA